MMEEKTTIAILLVSRKLALLISRVKVESNIVKTQQIASNNKKFFVYLSLVLTSHRMIKLLLTSANKEVYSRRCCVIIYLL